MRSVSAAHAQLQNVPKTSPAAVTSTAIPITTAMVPAVHSPTAAIGGGRRAIVLAVCCSALFMVGLDNTIVNVGLPDIGESLHTAVSGLQWTVAGYTIVLASLLMFSGAAADRIGRRTIFQVGLSLFTLGSWLCSLAPSLAWLITFRILQGVGGSMLAPSALGIITNAFSRPGERPPPPPPPGDVRPLSPPTATVDSSLTVSSCPCGQVHGADDSLIGRVSSNVSPQARQRYS